MIDVKGTHITKYLGICHLSREWQHFQIQIEPVVAGACWGVKKNRNFFINFYKLKQKNI